jgi:hypothetical protein
VWTHAFPRQIVNPTTGGYALLRTILYATCESDPLAETGKLMRKFGMQEAKQGIKVDRCGFGSMDRLMGAGPAAGLVDLHSHTYVYTTHPHSVIDSYNRLQDDAQTTQTDRNLSVQTLVNAYYGARCCLGFCLFLFGWIYIYIHDWTDPISKPTQTWPRSSTSGGGASRSTSPTASRTSPSPSPSSATSTTSPRAS